MAWQIELLGNGLCDLTKDRKIVAYDLDFYEAIERGASINDVALGLAAS